MKVIDESKSSKIEEIIKHSIEVKKEEALNQIKETCDREIDRINGVYTSIMKTLETLELQDASLLDFFEKSKGNVRVLDYNPYDGHYGRIELNFPDNRTGYQYLQNPINLRVNTKYKIILIAIEQNDEDKQ